MVSRFSSPFILTCHGKARRTVYGAHMLPQTTDFGVTPNEARALHKKQHESDSKMVCLGLSGGCMMLSSVLWQV